MSGNHSAVKAGAATPEVKEIDRKLRALAQQQAALDADEAHLLRIADAQNAWPALGYTHALEYLEDVFGYAPRTAMERLRVARELGELPQLEDALRVGELSYSAVRELSRVATPATVESWIERARGRRFRDVEQMVSGRRKGDDPDAPPDPAVVKHRLVLELDGESLATWRQMRQVLELEVEHNLDDRSTVLALGERILSAAVHGRDTRTPADPCDDAKINVDDATDATAGQASGSGDADVAHDGTVPASERATGLATWPRYLINITTCRACRAATQDGAGVRFAIDESVLERAECNAILCDDEQGKRATRTVPAAIERQVLERAQHRCQVPGCRSSKHLSIHHIIFWSQGGTHDLWNLIVLCDGHHRLLHDGFLTISGRAPDELVFTRNGQRLRAGEPTVTAELRAAKPRGLEARPPHTSRRHAALPPSDSATRSKRPPADAALADDHAALARAALCQLGYKAAIASRAVEAALTCVRADAELVELIKEALRHCH